MSAKIQHTFNKPTITPPPRILNIILLIYKIIKTFSQKTHTNENSLSGLQIIHILITPLPRDKRP